MTRPKLPTGEALKVGVQVRLTAEQAGRLDAVCGRRGRAAYIRGLLVKALGRNAAKPTG